MKDNETSAVEQIAVHVERHLGKIVNVFPDAAALQPLATGAADAPRILVHHVPATDARPVHTLVTSGMSTQPMAVPADGKTPRYIELMLTLPRQWRFDADSLRQEKWRWPIDRLRRLAHLPAAHGAALTWGQAIPNGDPPQPLAPGSKLCGVIIAPSLFVPPEFYELHAGGKTIVFYAAIPLYDEELALHREHGMEALLAKLLDHGIQDVIDLRRRNVARRKILGLF